MSPHVGPSWHQIGSKLAPSWPMLAQVDPSEPKLAPRWPQDGAKLAHVGSCWPEVGPMMAYLPKCRGSPSDLSSIHLFCTILQFRFGTCCQERVSRHESHIKNGHHESHIKHDHPLACDLWDCSNLVLLSSCLAMSFLSKRFIQTFPPGVPVDVSFLLLHLFRALHEGTLVSTW